MSTNDNSTTIISDDGNAVRVQPGRHSDRSGYDNAADSGGVHIGGLYSGQTTADFSHNIGTSPEPMRVTIGPSDLGGFTARDSGGLPVTDIASLCDTDIITMPGAPPTTVEVALSAGLLRRDPKTGLLTAAVTANELARREQQEEATDEQKAEQNADQAKQEMKLDETTEQLLGTAFEANAGAVMDAAHDLVTTGEITPASIERLADANGATADQVRAAADHVIQAQTTAVISRTAKTTGIDPALVQQALYEAQQSQASGFNEARMRAFDNGKYDGFTPFVEEWAASMGDTPEGREAILAANAKTGRVRVSGNDLVVRLDSGHEVSWRVAVVGRHFNFKAGK